MVKHRNERLLVRGNPKYVRCYDNGGRSFDRYTVVFTGHYRNRKGCDYLGMSAHPCHPQGFGQHGWAPHIIDRPAHRHLGKRVGYDQLPEECRALVMSDYRSIWCIEK